MTVCRAGFVGGVCAGAAGGGGDATGATVAFGGTAAVLIDGRQLDTEHALHPGRTLQRAFRGGEASEEAEA